MARPTILPGAASPTRAAWSRPCEWRHGLLSPLPWGALHKTGALAGTGCHAHGFAWAWEAPENVSSTIFAMPAMPTQSRGHGTQTGPVATFCAKLPRGERGESAHRADTTASHLLHFIRNS